MTNLSSDYHMLRLARTAFADNWEKRRSAKNFAMASTALFVGLAVITFPLSNVFSPIIYATLSLVGSAGVWANRREQKAHERALREEVQSDETLPPEVIANVPTHGKKWSKKDITDALDHLTDIHNINRLLARVDAYDSLDDDAEVKLKEKLRIMDGMVRLEKNLDSVDVLDQAMQRNAAFRLAPESDDLAMEPELTSNPQQAPLTTRKNRKTI